jgi:Condensation domain
MSSVAEAGLARRRTVVVDFTAERSRSGPLAWGQQALWNAIRRMRPDDHYYNISREFALPEDRSFGIDEVAAALGRVLVRHESLRTRLVDDGERPTQAAAASGRLAVEVVACESGTDAEAAGAAIRARYDRTAYEYRSEWPLRVAVVETEGRPRRVVFGFCHLFTDLPGTEFVLRDFERYLRDPGVEPPAAPQTLDLAADQHAEAGRLASGKALAYWEEQYRRIPPTMFPDPIAPPQELPFWTGALASDALAAALPLAARRYEVSDSVVLMAACAAAAARLRGNDLCAMLVIVGNRFRDRQRELVSSLAMEGILTVDLVRVGTFGELATQAWSAAARTYRFAEYDELDRDAMISRVSRDRGTPVHPYCCYNDVRSVADRPVAPQDAPDPRAALPHTEFAWVRKLPKVACRFCIHVLGGPERFRFDLTADTAYLPPEVIERYLRAVELLIVEAATDDVPMTALDAMLS